MNKMEMVNQAAAELGMDPGSVRRAAETVFRLIGDALCRGERAKVRGFGTFKAVRSNKKAARDIRRGKAVACKPHDVVKFVPGSILKRKVAGKEGGGQ